MIVRALTLACIWLSFSSAFDSSSTGSDDHRCFCQLEGQIDDCMCNIDTVDYFNNANVAPLLSRLLQKDYFRYFKYNARKPCPFWDASDGKCKNAMCGVKACSPDELPAGLKEEEGTCGQPNKDEVDNTISDEARASLKSWSAYDDLQSNFCELDSDESCTECNYVDLVINPERFTGYAGDSANRVWRAIYEENCFRPPGTSPKAAFLPDKLYDMCLEKRAFFRAVSGLHTSITVHLTAQHPDGESAAGKGASIFSSVKEHGPNLDLFLRRFDPEKTGGMGPFWLKNLYFVYLLEMRALAKAAPFLEAQAFYTGNEKEDADTLEVVRTFLELVKSFPESFDETTMFASGGHIHRATLKREFRDHFLNVSRVMDCVTCDKCKLWGKLQITGLGTALKILFSDEPKTTIYDPLTGVAATKNASNPDNITGSSSLRLTRNEIVALFNAFGRISTSIRQVDEFRRMMKKN